MAFCVLRDSAQSIPQKYYLIKIINHREGPCVFNCPLWFKSITNKMCTIACLHTWLSVHAEGCIQHSILWLLYKRMIAPALETAFKERKHLKWCLFYWQSQYDQMICLLARTDALSPQAHFPATTPAPAGTSACRSGHHGKDGDADGASWATGLSSTIPCRCALSRDRCLNCLGPCLPWLPSSLPPVEKL